MNHETYDPRFPIWLVFDLSNGHPGSRQYVWWFRTRREAIEHKRKQESDPRNAKLSPVRRFAPTN